MQLAQSLVKLRDGVATAVVQKGASELSTPALMDITAAWEKEAAGWVSADVRQFSLLSLKETGRIQDALKLAHAMATRVGITEFHATVGTGNTVTIATEDNSADKAPHRQ